MTKRGTISLILFLLLSLTGLKAQTNDAQMWLSVDLEKKLNPKLSLHFAEELRMNENITEAGTIFSDLAVSYDLTRSLNASVNYRFINKRRLDDTYDFRHRFYVDLTYKVAPKPVIITLRARVQQQYTDFFTSEKGRIPKNYGRTRLKLAYDQWKPFRPFVAAEIFIPFDNKKYSSFTVDCIRYQAGLEYKFNKHHSLSAFYMIQRERNVADPETDFVSGLGYSYVF